MRKGQKRVWKEVGENCKYTWHSEKLPNGKKPTFLFCFCSPKMQGVEDKQSRCVGVKFLIEAVLKLQNIVVNKKVTIKQIMIFKRKSLQVGYQTYFV